MTHPTRLTRDRRRGPTTPGQALHLSRDAQRTAAAQLTDPDARRHLPPAPPLPSPPRPPVAGVRSRRHLQVRWWRRLLRRLPAGGRRHDRRS
jgi:hypothetical protein